MQGASKTRTTLAYRLAEELKELVNGLLLLSATPMQVHPFELYSLIELVEPGLFPTFGVYDSRRGFLPRLNALMKPLVGWNALSDADQAAAAEASAELLADLGIPVTMAVPLVADGQEPEHLMAVLISNHPLAAALRRNRTPAAGGPTPRGAR